MTALSLQSRRRASLKIDDTLKPWLGSSLPLLLAACGGGGAAVSQPTPIRIPQLPAQVIAPGQTVSGNVLTPGGSGSINSLSFSGLPAGIIGTKLDTPFGSFLLNADGTFTFSLADTALVRALTAGQTRDIEFSFGTSARDTGGLTIRVTGINDAPTVTNGSGTVSENATVSLIDGNITIRDPDTGQTTTLASLNGNAISGSGSIDTPYGRLSINSDGAWSYVLANANAATNALREGQQVTDTITVTVRDDAGATSTATIAVTINGVNDAPVLSNPDSLSLSLLRNVALNLLSPSDDDAAPSISIRILELPQSGVITKADGSALMVDDVLSVADLTSLRFAVAGTNLGSAGRLRYSATDAAGAISSELIELIITSDANDVLGTSSDDSITVDAGGKRYFGLAGVDNFIFFYREDVTIAGGNGSDSIILDANGRTGTITLDIADGGTGPLRFDLIENVQTRSPNALVLLGNERVNALTGGVGDDQLDGRGGNDTLIGGLGADILSGGAGNDSLDARDDDSIVDTVRPGTGADIIYADLGDIIDYADAVARIAFSAGAHFGSEGEAANDSLLGVVNMIGSSFDDHLGGNAVSNLLIGGSGDDVLEGMDGRDKLFGGAGADQLEGGDGNDLLIGGTGLNSIAGQAGADWIVARDREQLVATGGLGADVFILATDQTSGAAGIAYDVRITDFITGSDRIDLFDLRDSDGTALTLADLVARQGASGATMVIDLAGLRSAGGETISGSLKLDGLAGTPLSAGQFYLGSDGPDWEALLPAGLAL
jgi:VCBS repeat-containing protein